MESHSLKQSPILMEKAYLIFADDVETITTAMITCTPPFDTSLCGRAQLTILIYNKIGHVKV